MTPRRHARTGPDALGLRDPRGFSLIEVMVAVMVFAIGALSLAAVIPLGSGKASQAGRQTLAAELATDRAERLLSTPYDDPDLEAGVHLDPANPRDRYYFVRWNVEADQPVTACKRVTITVHRPALTSPAVVRFVVVVPQNGS
jgi:prepilin-type N-terminal cleavage/methylation domain-containing protein